MPLGVCVVYNVMSDFWDAMTSKLSSWDKVLDQSGAVMIPRIACSAFVIFKGPSRNCICQSRWGSKRGSYDDAKERLEMATRQQRNLLLTSEQTHSALYKQVGGVLILAFSMSGIDICVAHTPG
jgi:hypothetical protein